MMVIQVVFYSLLSEAYSLPSYLGQYWIAPGRGRKRSDVSSLPYMTSILVSGVKYLASLGQSNARSQSEI